MSELSYEEAKRKIHSYAVDRFDKPLIDLMDVVDSVMDQGWKETFKEFDDRIFRMSKRIEIASDQYSDNGPCNTVAEVAEKMADYYHGRASVENLRQIGAEEVLVTELKRIAHYIDDKELENEKTM